MITKIWRYTICARKCSNYLKKKKQRKEQIFAQYQFDIFCFDLGQCRTLTTGDEIRLAVVQKESSPDEICLFSRGKKSPVAFSSNEKLNERKSISALFLLAHETFIYSHHHRRRRRVGGNFKNFISNSFCDSYLLCADGEREGKCTCVAPIPGILSLTTPAAFLILDF